MQSELEADTDRRGIGAVETHDQAKPTRAMLHAEEVFGAGLVDWVHGDLRAHVDQHVHRLGRRLGALGLDPDRFSLLKKPLR